LQILSLKWAALLLLSTSTLVWRLVDFADEAANEAFHMTRLGIALQGADAEALQLLIILGSIALMGNAMINLVRLHFPTSAGGAAGAVRLTSGKHKLNAKRN
jgi:hypothetical protein